MIKVLNTKTNTFYILTDKTAFEWIKEDGETWVAVSGGVQKGAPAKKATQKEIEEIMTTKEEAKEEEEKENEVVEKEEPKKLDYDEMTNPELKALCDRLGCKVVGRPNKAKLIELIKEKLGE